MSSLGRVYVDIVYLFQKNRRILVSFYSGSRGAEVVVVMFFSALVSTFSFGRWANAKRAKESIIHRWIVEKIKSTIPTVK